MMKKTISALLVCVLLVGTLLSLVSCGIMLSGKYELKITDDNHVVYEFSGKKVTKTKTSGILGYSKSETVEGKYEINEVEEGKFQITFTWETEEDNIETLDFSQGEENGTKYIKLGGFTLNKVD
jgi:hypothetical protein